jgi:hypothetical protein
MLLKNKIAARVINRDYRTTGLLAAVQFAAGSSFRSKQAASPMQSCQWAASGKIT